MLLVIFVLLILNNTHFYNRRVVKYQVSVSACFIGVMYGFACCSNSQHEKRLDFVLLIGLWH